MNSWELLWKGTMQACTGISMNLTRSGLAFDLPSCLEHSPWKELKVEEAVPTVQRNK